MMTSSGKSKSEGGRFVTFLTAAAAFFSSCIISPEKHTDYEKKCKGSRFLGKFGKGSKQKTKATNSNNNTFVEDGGQKVKIGWFYNKLVSRFKGKADKKDDNTVADDVFNIRKADMACVFDSSHIASVAPPAGCSKPTDVMEYDRRDVDSCLNGDAYDDMIIPDNSNLPLERTAPVVCNRNVWEAITSGSFSTTSIKTVSDRASIAEDNTTSIKTLGDRASIADDNDGNIFPERPPTRASAWNAWEDNESGPTINVHNLDDTASICDNMRGNTSPERPPTKACHWNDWEVNESETAGSISVQSVSDAASISGSATSLTSHCSGLSEEDIVLASTSETSISCVPEEVPVADEISALTSMAQEFHMLLARAENISRLSTRDTPSHDPIDHGVHDDQADNVDMPPIEENANISQIKRLQNEVDELIKGLMPEMNYFL